MQLTELDAISPIDGRYRSKTISLSPYFSEEALIKYRVLVEVEYFIALREADLPQLAKIDKSIYDSLRAIYKNFSTEDALWVKETEKTTNHDVNTAIPLSTKEAFENVYLPSLVSVIAKLKELAMEWKDVPMLARTHGQPASPTLLGKEIYSLVILLPNVIY